MHHTVAIVTDFPEKMRCNKSMMCALFPGKISSLYDDPNKA